VNSWNERYAREDFFYGIEPNRFLAGQADRLRPGMRALVPGDGEGRNGVWLASQGLDVLSVDISPVGLGKAEKLARQRGVRLATECADLCTWEWPSARFDLIAAIFIQFADPACRARLFAGIGRALKPDGLLILQGYTPRQLEYGTGGPPCAENMYTADMLRTAFAGFDIRHLREHDGEIREGIGHSGISALVDMVAAKPVVG
jgi:SAM-dependent methyltransferase